MSNRFFQAFAGLLLCSMAATAAEVSPVATAAKPCIAKYGEAVAFERCNPLSLPDITVRFVGNSIPIKGVPMVCWDYEASAANSEKTVFKQCHTGALGGRTSFPVAGKSFTVEFDVDQGCKRSPAGTWAYEIRGMMFHATVLSADALEKLWAKRAQSEAACFARNADKK